MKFYSEEFPLPEGFQTDEFIFRPLRVSDVDLDYDAVISSGSMLRAWSQSNWPADGFTPEENLADLRRHAREHQDKNAFTYTIMNAEETFCLGCIYLNPLIQEIVDLDVCDVPAKDREFFAASVRYWIRESLATEEFSFVILKSLIQWLDYEWCFNCVVFPLAITDSLQAKLLVESGFVLMGDVYDEPRMSHWKIYKKVQG